ncbi:5'-methylthioadenosine/S-adenosylhomocysteine nucleosidase [Streptomyces sp. NPDC006743]|uniref:5'-methylthioadenosine/S-adenosylhomocysteine nucleosidase family protein n=1 Tax=Streptomyces sp. NPDC006743 TaxID=3154480 RepID=UPI003451B9E3
MRSPSGKIVVFTALPLEYRAVRSHVTGLQRVDHEAGTIFEHGRIPETNWEVYLAQVGQGNQGAAILTERAIQMIRPDAVFFTGIAGGMKHDLALGDVVVATRVFAYHGGKQEGTFKTRPETWQASHRLEQAARFAALDPRWARAPLPAGREAPEVHFKPIAAGEVVVNAQASALQELLDEHYNGVAAIETEGAGFAGAASLADQVPALVIRGISDRADGSKQQTDTGGFQLIAADNAAALTIAVVKALPSPGATKAELQSSRSDTVDAPPIAALIGQQLKEPMPVTWRTKLLPPRSSESATLEVHLIAEDSPWLPLRQMNQLKDKLVSLGRSEAFFTATEEVSSVLEADFAAAYARDPRSGRSVGLLITRSGQLSCWESLPRSTRLHMPVLDPKHTQERVADLLRLLLRLHDDIPHTRFAPALAIDPADMLTVMSLEAARSSTSATLARSGRGGAVQITPDEIWDAANVGAAVPTIAEELTLRLMQHF